jgi:hypothetical protein
VEVQKRSAQGYVLHAIGKRKESDEANVTYGLAVVFIVNIEGPM